MRSTRLLISANRNKFTEHKSASSPTRRMPETRYGRPCQPFTVSNLHTYFSRNFTSLNLRVPSPHCSDSLLERVTSKNLSANSHFHSKSKIKEPDIFPEPSFRSLDIKRFFRLRSLQWSETHASIKVDIPIQLLGNTLRQNFDPKDLRTPTVHIDKKTGNFIIPKHGVYGSWQDIELLIETWVKNRKLKRNESTSEYPVMATLEVTTDARSRSEQLNEESRQYERLSPVQNISIQEFNRLLRNFNLRRVGIETKDLSRLEIRVNSELNQMVVPIRYSNGSLVGYRKIFLEEEEVKEINLPSVFKQSVLPFPHGFDKAHREASTACILVGSILDSIVIASRTNIPAITLPDSGNLRPDHIPFLDQFETVFIWLNNDIQGAQNAKLFAQKIGEKKCRLVPGLHQNPAQAVHKGINVERVLSEAKSIYHESLTTFENLRDNVYLEFLQSEEMLGVKWHRFEAMNAVMGGFRRGELTIFSGKTGTGKTTFLSEYSLDLCMQGVNTLWCSFEVRNTRLLRVMMKQFSLLNIDDKLEEFDNVADKFTRLPLYLTDFHGSQELHKVVDAMSHAVYVHDINHVIVDNMQFMLGTSGSSGSLDRFHIQDKAIETFRRFATSHNCHVTLVIHPRKEDEEVLTSNSIFGGAKATQEADNVCLLQEEKVPDSFLKRKSIEVVKNRYFGNVGRVFLKFCKPINTLSKQAFDTYMSHNSPGPDQLEIEAEEARVHNRPTPGLKKKSNGFDPVPDTNSPFKEKGKRVHRKKSNEVIFSTEDDEIVIMSENETESDPDKTD